MANSDLYIGLGNGKEGFEHDDFVIQSTSSGADIELHIKATDANGNTIKRKSAIKALEAFQRVLTSNGIFTTDLAE